MWQHIRHMAVGAIGFLVIFWSRFLDFVEVSLDIISLGGVRDDISAWMDWLNSDTVSMVAPVVGICIILYAAWPYIVGRSKKSETISHPAESNTESLGSSDRTRRERQRQARSPAAQAFDEAPFLGKRAAAYILEQTSAEEAETILWTFRRQSEPIDAIFAEAAWVELLASLGDERPEYAAFDFGAATIEEPRRNEAEEFARQALSKTGALKRRATPISDQTAIEANPGNGWRVHRLILTAMTVDEVEAFYEDFMSHPHKSREALVFATYHLKISKLDGDTLGDCWAKMTAAAWKHEREFMNLNFQKQVVEEAGQIQRKLWPD